MLPVVAPEFGSKPKNASAPMKGEAKFEVDFDGEPKPDVKWWVINQLLCSPIVGFTPTVLNDICWALSRSWTNCHKILQALLSSD